MYGLDLFSGIGGITKALEPWVVPMAYCENDRYAQAVLLSRMGCGDLPIAPIWGDIRTLDATPIEDWIEIIYGGFPCQDISVAGRGAGLAGERSGLFFQIARLVGEIRPAFCFLENVPAITSRGGWEVVGAFAALGYDCRWDMLSAYDVGAPHLRERWFLLAHADKPNGKVRRDGELDGGKAVRCVSAKESKRCGENVADADAIGRNGRAWELGPGRGRKLADSGQTMGNATIEGFQDRGEKPLARSEKGSAFLQSERSDWWPVEPDVGRVAHGVPSRVDRLRGLGNAVCPPQAREAFRRLMGL